MATQSRVKAAAAAASKNGFSLISDEKLKQIYSTMLKCRVLEEHAQSSAELKSALDRRSFLGQEACQVGATIDLRLDDTVLPARRGFLAGLVLGKSLDKIYATFFSGRNVKSENNGFAPDKQYAAAQTKAALEIAFANESNKNGGIVILFGEGPGTQRYWLDALSTAGNQRLPILFVLPARRGGKPGSAVETLPLKPSAFPIIPVDGNDVVAVYRVAFESIERARLGGGATLIDCAFVNHKDAPEIASGNPNGAAARNFDDPITFMEAYLTRKGLFREGWKKKLLSSYESKLGQNRVPDKPKSI